ncbi:MAG: hypothetical protein R6X09_03865 [Bacteroidales bacterium]
MYQKDYILRMIEMLGDLLRAIFGMITNGQFEQAEKSLHEAYLTTLRKDASFFQQIPIEKLTDELIQEHNFTNAHLEILAELMFAEASLLFSKNKKQESLPFYHKSLLLFKFVNEAYRVYSRDRIEKMEKITERLSEIDNS